MPWYTPIILGFIIIAGGFVTVGMGVVEWLDSHSVEKVYEKKEYFVMDLDGNIIQHEIDPSLFKKYKIVRKDPEK